MLAWKVAPADELVSVTLCPGGSPPPAAWLKVRLSGDTVTVVFEVMVSDTGMVKGLEGSFDDEMEMVPPNTYGGSVPGLMITSSDWGVELPF